MLIRKKIGAGNIDFERYGILQRAIINASVAIAKDDANRAVYQIAKYWESLSTVDDPELKRTFQRQFSAKGGDSKRGHEGPLKQLLRDIIGSRKIKFDHLCEILGDGNHLQVDDFDGETLTFTYTTKSGDKVKTVNLSAIRRAYREIISTLQ